MSALVVFVGSWIAAHVLLLVERLVGIGWDFHPDAVAYVTETTRYSLISEVPNNLYFFIASWLGGDVDLLIELNILAYSLANTIGWLLIQWYGRDSGKNRTQLLVVALVFLIQPYRLHLAVHVLKDTLIFLMLLLTMTGAPRRIWSAAIILVLLRVPSLIYLIGRMSTRFVLVLFVVSAIFLIQFNAELFDFLASRNTADMGGRDFDTVPSFKEYGIVGTVLRGITWPLLLLSGAFWIVSPSIALFPVAIELVSGRWALSRVGKVAVKWVPVLAVLGLIAIIVNTYTSYIRYCYPLICLLPIIGLKFIKK